MRKKKGQAAVEIALMLPILLLLLCGITDFGRILYITNTLNIVSQEAVRYASFGKDDSQIDTFIRTNAAVGDKTPDILGINISPSIRKSGDYVTVKITYKINYITPLINKILPSPYQIKTQSTIRVE